MMNPRKIRDNVFALGAIDWDRRLFDALIPLPDGTSYNAYLVQGREKTVLLDTVDPAMWEVLQSQLEHIPRLDYVVAHHAEQDHAGCLPHVLARYPEARLLTSPKGRGLLIEHLDVPPERITPVADGETLALGGKTLRFLHTPWVHWPETFVSYLEEDQVLFSCDFFGSHLATSELYVTHEAQVYEAAKRYYAEIMMPFRGVIAGNLEKVSRYPLSTIAPSHGPVYDKPAFILEAYQDWVSGPPKNEVVLPYISMHGSTAIMVRHLVAELAARDVRVLQFNLSEADIGKLAIALVDAATLVVGTPTVHLGPHPAVFYAAHLANALRPKLRFASIIGSFGWGHKTIDRITALIPNLKVEILDPVLCQGAPRPPSFEALARLADTIAGKHRECGLK